MPKLAAHDPPAVSATAAVQFDGSNAEEPCKLRDNSIDNHSVRRSEV